MGFKPILSIFQPVTIDTMRENAFTHAFSLIVSSLRRVTI